MPSHHALAPVEIGGKAYQPIREGLATILAPHRAPDPSKRNDVVKPEKSSRHTNTNPVGEQTVFYNPIQQFNRDLSVLAILVYGEAALVRKRLFSEKKSAVVKRRRDNAKKRKDGSALTEGGAAVRHVGAGNPRKRKLDEVDVDGESGAEEGQGAMVAGKVDGSVVKKPKVDDFGLDEENLEVMELGTEELVPVGERPAAPSPAAPIARPAQPAPGDRLSDDRVPQHDAAQRENPEATNPCPDPPYTVKQPPQRGGTSFTILDALSATGLRALRYAKEVPFATTIVANDLDPEAVRSIERNVRHNGLEHIIHANVDDARRYMYGKVGNERPAMSGTYVHRFDVIDLDPYGTAAPFLDAAVQALHDGGLLCVTCTDAGVFASNGYPEKAYALYGGIPLKGAHSHEGGLRLILQAVATSAARYGIAIEPLLSLSIDYYARVFVRVRKQPKDVKVLAGRSMLVYSCDQGCGAWTTQPLAKNQAKEDRKGDIFFKHGFAQAPVAGPNCSQCGYKTHLGGPMWAGPLHNPYFVQRLLEKLPTLDKAVYGTAARIEGMLTVAMEEHLVFHPQHRPRSHVSDLAPVGTEVEVAEEEKRRGGGGKGGEEKEEKEEKEEDNADAENGNPSHQITPAIPSLPRHLIDPTPFFFIPNSLAKVVHCVTPSEDQLRGAIRHLGYRVTRSHCKAGSFKTDAPWAVVWEIYREWVRTRNPVRPGAVSPGTAGWQIMAGVRGSERKQVADFRRGLQRSLAGVESVDELRTALEAAMFRLGHLNKAHHDGNEQPDQADDAAPATATAAADIAVNGAKHDVADKDARHARSHPSSSRSASPSSTTAAQINPPSKLTIVFDERLGREKPRNGLVRYQMNPRANWGPMTKAGKAGLDQSKGKTVG